jgi:hypothetical protein
MPPKRGRGFALSVLLLVAGFVSAPLAVGDTPSRVGLPLVIGLGVPVTFLIARAQREKDTGAFLLSVMLAAIGIRLLVLALIHSSIGPAAFAPDTEEYWVVGQELLDAWQGERPVPRKLVGSFQIGYYILNAVAFMIFGRGAGAPVAVNILLASWLAVPIYHLTRLCVRGNHGVARWATIMALFFPSLILWSVLNIREAPTIFTVALVVFFLVRFQVYPRARDLLYILRTGVQPKRRKNNAPGAKPEAMINKRAFYLSLRLFSGRRRGRRWWRRRGWRLSRRRQWRRRRRWWRRRGDCRETTAFATRRASPSC